MPGLGQGFLQGYDTSRQDSTREMNQAAQMQDMAQQTERMEWDRIAQEAKQERDDFTKLLTQYRTTGDVHSSVEWFNEIADGTKAEVTKDNKIKLIDKRSGKESMAGLDRWDEYLEARSNPTLAFQRKMQQDLQDREYILKASLATVENASEPTYYVNPETKERWARYDKVIFDSDTGEFKHEPVEGPVDQLSVEAEQDIAKLEYYTALAEKARASAEGAEGGESATSPAKLTEDMLRYGKRSIREMISSDANVTPVYNSDGDFEGYVDAEGKPIDKEKAKDLNDLTITISSLYSDQYHKTGGGVSPEGVYMDAKRELSQPDPEELVPKDLVSAHGKPKGSNEPPKKPGLLSLTRLDDNVTPEGNIDWSGAGKDIANPVVGGLKRGLDPRNWGKDLSALQQSPAGYWSGMQLLDQPIDPFHIGASQFKDRLDKEAKALASSKKPEQGTGKGLPTPKGTPKGRTIPVDAKQLGVSEDDLFKIGNGLVRDGLVKSDEEFLNILDKASKKPKLWEVWKQRYLK